MVEAIESRMQDWNKLELVGEPLAFSDDKMMRAVNKSHESEEEEETNSEIIETSETC